MESAAFANGSAAAETSVTAFPAATVETRTSAIESRTTSIVSASAVEPMKPWTRAHEHAPIKIIRAIVTVRRARIWRVSIIAIGANRRPLHVGWPTVNWPDSYSNTKSDLRVGSSRPRNRNKESQHHSIFEISHIKPPDSTRGDCQLPLPLRPLNQTLLVVQRTCQRGVKANELYFIYIQLLAENRRAASKSRSETNGCNPPAALIFNQLCGPIKIEVDAPTRCYPAGQA